MTRRAQPRDDLQLLQSGEEFFPALRGLIDSAKRSVWLETYIFADDATGHAIAQSLAAAARRGVDVRVVVAGFGTRPLSDAIAAPMRTAGVQLRIYSPVPRLLTLDRSRLRRLHRKLACIDGQWAFVGGINILDDFVDPNHGPLTHPRLDYAVRLQGTQVDAVAHCMSRLWEQLIAPHMIERTVREPRRHAASSKVSRVQLLLRDNLANRRSIERAYLRAIGQARHEVLIATAYFFPGRRFRRALREAAARGVRVRLLLQGRTEYILPHHAAQALYDSLLGHGIEIIEYHRSFLHAKVAVVDDWATVGSSNIDPFSLLLAREANLVIRDKPFADNLRARLLAAMQEGSQPIAVDEHRRRGWWQRVWGWIAYGLLRLGVLVSGERQRY